MALAVVLLTLITTLQMTTERKRLLRKLYSGTVFVTENTIFEGHKLFASQNETTLYGCNDV